MKPTENDNMTVAIVTFQLAGHDYSATVNCLDSLRSFAAGCSFRSVMVEDAGCFSMSELAAAVYPSRAEAFLGLPDNCITEDLGIDEDMLEDERSAAGDWRAWVTESSDWSLKTSKVHLFAGGSDVAVCGARPKGDVFDWLPSDESDITACRKCERAAK